MTKLKEEIVKIYLDSLTPFEKMENNLINEKILPNEYFDDKLKYWNNIISSTNNQDEINRYFCLLGLNKDAIIKMLSPVRIGADSIFPNWVNLLNDVLKYSDTPPSNNKCAKDIPFSTLLYPFIGNFKSRISSTMDMHKESIISNKLLLNLEIQLFQKLSNISQATYQKEFDLFKNMLQEKSKLDSESEAIDKKNLYPIFVAENSNNNFMRLLLKYPMMARLLAMSAYNFSIFISKIICRYSVEKDEIGSYFNLNRHLNKIVDVQIDIGDQHGAESTAVLIMNSDQKLIFKPGNLSITEVYNNILSWVNSNLAIKLKFFKVLPKNDYGWLEFIENSDCDNESGILNYYKHAGALLGITYFLNSSDFHYENLIASGENPVLIDHETIVQPKLKKEFNPLSKTEIILYEESVLKPSLLPMIVPKVGISHSSICGFGSSKKNSISHWTKSIINCNTYQSQRILYQKIIDFEKSNVPKLHGKPKKLAGYYSIFIEGFKLVYDLFSKEKKFLLSENSPIEKFHNKIIRYVWRPTNIYATIKKQLLEPEFLADSTKYGLKLELLSRAYMSRYSELIPLLSSERKQLLMGDTPIFKVSCDSKHIFHEHEEYQSIFELDAITCITKKISNVSTTDYNFQLSLIKECVLL